MRIYSNFSTIYMAMVACFEDTSESASGFNGVSAMAVHKSRPGLRGVRGKRASCPGSGESGYLDDQTLQVADKVDSLTGRLREFADFSTFEVARFNKQAEGLEKQLTETRKLLWSVGSSRDLAKQLRFCRHMFVVMRDSVNLLELAPQISHLHLILIYKVFELDVRLCALYDSKGDPDTEVEGFAKKVFYSLHLLNYWGRSFRSIRSISTDAKIAFEDKFKKTRDTLFELEKHATKVQ